MRGRGAGALVASAIAVVAWSAAPAQAVVSGPCTATIAGTDVAGLSATDPADAVEIDADQTLDVAASASGGIGSYEIELEFAGVRWKVASGAASGDSWDRKVKMSTYARFGVGLYKVRAVSTGGATCTAAALVEVTGRSPLTTAAGAGGVVLTAVGVTGLVRAVRRGARR